MHVVMLILFIIKTFKMTYSTDNSLFFTLYLETQLLYVVCLEVEVVIIFWQPKTFVLERAVQDDLEIGIKVIYALPVTLLVNDTMS